MPSFLNEQQSGSVYKATITETVTDDLGENETNHPLRGPLKILQMEANVPEGVSTVVNILRQEGSEPGATYQQIGSIVLNDSTYKIVNTTSDPLIIAKDSGLWFTTTDAISGTKKITVHYDRRL